METRRPATCQANYFHVKLQCLIEKGKHKSTTASDQRSNFVKNCFVDYSQDFQGTFYATAILLTWAVLLLVTRKACVQCFDLFECVNIFHEWIKHRHFVASKRLTSRHKTATKCKTNTKLLTSRKKVMFVFSCINSIKYILFRVSNIVTRAELCNASRCQQSSCQQPTKLT